MLRKVLVIFAVTAIVTCCMYGCKKSSEESKSTGAEEEATKTMAEYKTEAEQEIDKENMLEELEKLEKEIDREAELQR
jgi:Tfp pilus assembly protein PilO